MTDASHTLTDLWVLVGLWDLVGQVGMSQRGLGDLEGPFHLGDPSSLENLAHPDLNRQTDSC